LPNNKTTKLYFPVALLALHLNEIKDFIFEMDISFVIVNEENKHCASLVNEFTGLAITFTFTGLLIGFETETSITFLFKTSDVK
jgi:hypothetical protein